MDVKKKWTAWRFLPWFLHAFNPTSKLICIPRSPRWRSLPLHSTTMMSNCSSIQSSSASFISIKRILLHTLRMHSFKTSFSTWCKIHCLRSFDSNLVVRRLDGWWTRPRLRQTCLWTMLLPTSLTSRTQVIGRWRFQVIPKSLHWQCRSPSLRLKCPSFHISKLQQDIQRHPVAVLELPAMLELATTVLNFGVLRKLTAKQSSAWSNGMERLGIDAIITHTITKVLSLRACTSFTSPARSMMHGAQRKIASKRVVPRSVW